MEFHVITPNGSRLIYSTEMSNQARKTLAQIDADRRAFIKSGKVPAPTGRCFYCDSPVAPKVIYCSNDCVREAAAERAALAADPGPTSAR